MTPGSTEVRLDGLHLHRRPGVASRESTTATGALFYLSLYEDEIAERWERFLNLWDAGETRREVFADLELTDALVIYEQPGKVNVVRGGSCSFPLFWKRGQRALTVSTALPLHQGGPLRVSAFAPVIAALCMPGSFEPNAYTEAPLHGWFRFRRGFITSFEVDGTVSETAIPVIAPEELDEEQITERVRAAFLKYGESQRHVTSSVVELSGGFDSTLAAATALRPEHVMRGISMEFPYYEFRFEAAVQRSVQEALQITRHVVDGLDVLPYTPAARPPRFDEPALFVTGIRHAERVGEFAAAHNAARIYMGHGGDHVFASDLWDQEIITAPPTLDAFTPGIGRLIQACGQRMREPRWRQRSGGQFVYEARQDVWIKETFGATIRTPFTDLFVFRAGQSWSRWRASKNRRPDKTILLRALPDLLPRAVTERKGKVAYDGVWARSYRANRDHMTNIIERARSSLERIGILPGQITSRIQSLSRWERVSEREVLVAYGIAVWLISWGFENASKSEWIDR